MNTSPGGSRMVCNDRVGAFIRVASDGLFQKLASEEGSPLPALWETPKSIERQTLLFTKPLKSRLLKKRLGSKHWASISRVEVQGPCSTNSRNQLPFPASVVAGEATLTWGLLSHPR